jgi:hypothetical protein
MTVPDGQDQNAPLTRLGKWTVGIGVALVAAAAAVLFLGGTAAFDSCTSVTTSKLRGGDANPESPPSVELVTTKRVVTCSPSSLASGAPLVLAVLGGVFLAPGVLRLLPPGKYSVGGLTADTTHLGQQALDHAVQASALLAGLNAQGVSPPPAAVGADQPPAPPGS